MGGKTMDDSSINTGSSKLNGNNFGASKTTSSSTLSSSVSKKVFEKGQDVKIKRPLGVPGYDDGFIYDKNSDGTYVIKFTGGRIEQKVVATRISLPLKTSSDSDNKEAKGSSGESKSVGPESKSYVPIDSKEPEWKTGQEVEVRRNGELKYFLAKVISSSVDSYDVRYISDDRVEKAISPRFIRKPSNILKDDSEVYPFG